MLLLITSLVSMKLSWPSLFQCTTHYFVPSKINMVTTYFLNSCFVPISKYRREESRWPTICLLYEIANTLPHEFIIRPYLTYKHENIGFGLIYIYRCIHKIPERKIWVWMENKGDGYSRNQSQLINIYWNRVSNLTLSFHEGKKKISHSPKPLTVRILNYVFRCPLHPNQHKYFPLISVQ